MIHKFEEFLNEKNFQVVTNDNVINYRITYRYGEGGFKAMASTGKDNDKELSIGDSASIGKDIEDSINRMLKKYRQSFTVEQDHGYQGAGYSFYLNMDYILKLLNK
jgi:hypothetical protein